jgi:sRNA-binding protein
MGKLVLSRSHHERALRSLAQRGAAIPKPPPAVVSAEPNNKARRNEILTKLRARFPAFADPVPLAIGTRQEIVDLFAGDYRPTEIGHALRMWCGQTAYLQALAADGAMRVRLDGTQSEPVAPEHQEQAKRRLAEKRARRLSAAGPRPRPTTAVAGNSA